MSLCCSSLQFKCSSAQTQKLSCLVPLMFCCIVSLFPKKKLKTTGVPMPSVSSPSSSTACALCGHQWNTTLLKVVSACPRINCEGAPKDGKQGASSRFSCSVHGEMLAQVIKVETYKCPCEGCKKSLKRFCNFCARWLSASNFSKRAHKNVDDV